MEGRNFLTTATFLRDSGLNEAAYRSAISRAYYACFLEIRKAAFDNYRQAMRRGGGSNIKKENDIRHENLGYYLKNSSNERVRELGNNLVGLKDSRKDADYIMSSAILIEDADDAIDEARALLDDIDSVGPPAIGKAMEGYYSKLNPS